MTRITGRTSGKSVRQRKPTLLLVARLEQDLARAQWAIADRNKYLEKTREYLIQAIGERNRIICERDALQQKIEVDRKEYKTKEDQFRQELDNFQQDYDSLEEINRQNSEGAHRNGEVAAVMAFMLAAVDMSVLDVMTKFIKAAKQMRVSVDINDACYALKRGFSARIDQVVDNTLASQTKTNIPTDIPDEVVS